MSSRTGFAEKINGGIRPTDRAVRACGLVPERRLGFVTRRRFRRRRCMLLDRNGLRRLGRRRGVALEETNGNGDGDQCFQTSDFRLSAIHSRPLRRDLVAKALAPET
jgi:hypothetical protein